MTLVALATDGAPVMRGCRSGVTTQMKGVNPFLLANHCLAHRLALASEKAANKSAYLVHFIDVVNAVGKTAKYSPKFDRLLDAAKTLNDEEHALKLKQIFFTRWLSFNQSVEALVGGYSSLLSCLIDLSGEPGPFKVKAAGLLKQMGTYKFCVTAHFLADVMGCLSILSKVMQKRSLLYSSVRNTIDGTILTLEGLKHNNGKQMKAFLHCTDVHASEQSATFKGHCLSFSQKQDREFEDLRTSFIDDLVSDLHVWFPKETSEIMNAACVLDPRNLRHQNETLVDYGNKELDCLLAHFGQDKVNRSGVSLPAKVAPDSTKLEWQVLKSFLADEPSLTTEDFFRKHLLPQQDAFPNMAKLYAVVLCSPVTSVDCERGFSAYNLIKTSHRNCLTVAHTSQLATILLEGPPVKEFPFDKAFDIWISTKDRRGFCQLAKDTAASLENK